MDSTIKQRLIGAAVLAALAVIFLPMLLKGPDVKEPDAAQVPLSMPATPGGDYETRDLPLNAPDGTVPPGGVLRMAPVPANPVPATPAVGASTAIPLDSPPTASATAKVVESAPPVTAAGSNPATAASAPTSAPAALVGAGKFMVNIGSFGNLANANALAAKLRALQLPVVADRVTLASGSAMRLRVGPYPDRAAAEAARLRAEGTAGAGIKVVVLDAAPEPTTTAKPEAKPALAASKPAAAAKPVSGDVAPATPTSPPATPTSKPVALVSGFAVQLSAPSVEAEANALRDRARAQGFSSFVQRIETDSGVRYRVRVGPVADKPAAVALRDAVNGKLGSKGIVVANP